MKSSVIRTLAVAALSAGSLMALAACDSVKAAVYEKGTPVKVGLICLHNEESTYDKNFIDALDEAAEKLGTKVSYEKDCLLTGINEDQACFNAAKKLVKKGCNVIFADSFGHQDYMLKAAQKWPEVQFCHATGTNAKNANLDNYHNAFASIYQGRFLAGYAAGLKLVCDNAADIQAGNNIKVGYVGAFAYAEVKSGYTSWFLGVREAVKDVGGDASKVTMDVQFTDSWYDPQKESNAAQSLIAGGAKLISQHADSMGAPSACESAGVPNVTYNVETKTACPTTYVAYSRINWAPYYEAVVNALYSGKSIEGEVKHNWTGTAAAGSVEYNVNWDNVVSKLAEGEKESSLTAAKQLFDATEKEVVDGGASFVFDNSRWTVGGEHLTTYQADTDGDFAPDTNVMKANGDSYYFNESAECSAPYFDINIDGINLPA